MRTRTTASHRQHQAGPYLNSLRRGGATLTNSYAEERPSDANYLALAGGSAFGVPFTDPEEENPLYTIDAANIGDLVVGGGESCKAYLPSANGPCDDTVHGYYWNDDHPVMYFQDVRDRPRYCASHVAPLEELGSDLANPVTTPNFAGVTPDDCADMEGCGIAAGDEFLKTELTAIMNSSAWHPALARDHHVRRGRPGLPPPSPPSPRAWHLSPPRLSQARPRRRRARPASSPRRPA